MPRGAEPPGFAPRSHTRTASSPSLNGDEPGFFERAQSPAFCIWQYVPFPHGQVGDDKAIGTP